MARLELGASRRGVRALGTFGPLAAAAASHRRTAPGPARPLAPQRRRDPRCLRARARHRRTAPPPVPDVRGPLGEHAADAPRGLDRRPRAGRGRRPRRRRRDHLREARSTGRVRDASHRACRERRHGSAPRHEGRREPRRGRLARAAARQRLALRRVDPVPWLRARGRPVADRQGPAPARPGARPRVLDARRAVHPAPRPRLRTAPA